MSSVSDRSVAACSMRTSYTRLVEVYSSKDNILDSLVSDAPDHWSSLLTVLAVVEYNIDRAMV